MENEKKTKILLVDDDPVWIGLLGALIEKECGIICSFAMNGIEALDLIVSESFDLVLTDTNMGEMNGVELIKEIREIQRDLKVYIFFDRLNGSLIRKDEVLALGATGILSKADYSVLPSFIRKLLNI